MAARIKPAGSTEAERDAISLGVIEAYLDGAIRNELSCPSCQERFSFKEVNPAVISAIKIRYDKLRPTLSAVEQSVPDPLAGVSRSDLVARLKLLLQDPSIARELGIPVAPVAPVPNVALHPLDQAV